MMHQSKDERHHASNRVRRRSRSRRDASGPYGASSVASCTVLGSRCRFVLISHRCD